MFLTSDAFTDQTPNWLSLSIYEEKQTDWISLITGTFPDETTSPLPPLEKYNPKVKECCCRGALKLHIRTIDAASPAFPKSLEQYGLYVASMTLQGDSETRASRRRCRHGHRSDGRRLRLESRVQHINPMCVYNDGGAGVGEGRCCLITHVRMCERRGGGGDGGGGRIGDRKWAHMLEGEQGSSFRRSHAATQYISAGQPVAGCDPNLPLAPSVGTFM